MDSRQKVSNPHSSSLDFHSGKLKTITGIKNKQERQDGPIKWSSNAAMRWFREIMQTT